ncbi:SNF2 family N-terminal domain-containing protein [Scleroderma yunnanense]
MAIGPPLLVHHVESLRSQAHHYWPDVVHEGRTPQDRPFRPALNMRALMSLVQSNKGEEWATVTQSEGTHRVGEKRQTRSSTNARTSKRRKVDVHEDRRMYPYFWKKATEEALGHEFSPVCSFLPAFRWSVDIGYTKAQDDVDDASAKELGWLQEEEDAVSLVEALRENPSMSTVVNLGSFHPGRYLGRHLAIVGSSYPSPAPEMPLECEIASDRWLFLLPNIVWPDGLPTQELELYGTQNGDVHEDFLVACLTLQSVGRVKVETDLELHILPQGSYDPLREMPFRLRATFSVLLATPTIYEPIQVKPAQRKANLLEGLQRRMMALLSDAPLGSSVSTKVSTHVEQEVGDVTIPYFLSILRPAPMPLRGVMDESLQPDALNPTLLPFQRRTVSWMLDREGMQIGADGTVVLREPPFIADAPLPLFWERIMLDGQELFFNRLTAVITATLPEPSTTLGGILAEEPGLGKTIECIALMLLNPAPERNPTQKRWDPGAKIYVKEIKTTLIVTPPALAQQWADELVAHAPSLKVLVYNGWSRVGVPITPEDAQFEREQRHRTMAGKKRNRKRKEDDEDMVVNLADSGASTPMTDESEDDVVDWCTYVNKFDVCITTYNVLRLDLLVARAPPKRPRREDVIYSNLERPRSPLVMCEWYRVIMDEVQMMGTGKSEEMVSLIPRLSSFAVSGTPAKAQVLDLIHVLKFLRVDDVIGSSRAWQLLLKHGFKDQFAAFFQHYAVRTLKSAVKGELTIPQQRRYLVSIELGLVERQVVYDQALEEALQELGLDARGVAAYEGWQVDTGLLRNVLRRLRGICTHPQVGQLQRQGDKLTKSVLKSMTDVLEAMRDQHWRNLMDDRKAKILTLVRLAQLQQHSERDRDRYQRALDQLLTAEKEVNELIAEVKAAIAQHYQKGEVLKKEAQKVRESRRQNLEDGSQSMTTKKGKGKEVSREGSLLSEDEDDDDIEDQGLPKTPAGEEHRLKRRVLQQRLRECVMVLHRVKFLQGDVYHVLGPSNLEKEDACYGAAETVRKELLKSVEDHAIKAMLSLQVDETTRGVTEDSLQIALPYFKGGGIRSTHLFNEANVMIENQLNEQGFLIWQWRAKIIALLCQSLSNHGDQADGEEYARALDTQGEVEVYMQAYTALLADRREGIVAERTLLAAHESREKRKRQTKAAQAASQRAEPDMDMEVLEDIEVKPQHEVLHKELNDERKDIYLQFPGRAMKSILVDLSRVAASIHNDNDPEKVIARDGMQRLRTLIANQSRWFSALMDKMDADLAQLRKTFNERIVYFRQLQEISDSVVDAEWEGDVRHAMERCEAEYIHLGNRIITGRARQRYLDNMANGQQDGLIDDNDKICILCRCDFLQGFVTPCAHVFCEGCLTAWLTRRRGRVCPVCRVPVEMDQLQRFTIQDEQPPPPKPVLVRGEPVPVSHRRIEYNMINPSLFRDIQTVESEGSYGSKIQTLVRHLLHIQLVDPGAKSIVFSAWADSLHIIEHALYHNNIPYLRLDQAQGKKGAAKRFRTEPTLQVLLLHGERDNAGLNVTCASRVFLVESVVNHGFEVQAIARIDRMGQTRATEVFCYYAEDTVEKNILDLAARQGLSLYTKDNSAGSINVATFATDSKKKLVDSPQKTGKRGQPAQKGDFIFKVDDMLAILFPHMFEDVEYLIPPDEGAQPVSASSTSNLNSTLSTRRVVHINAEAGPSRLPM